MTNGETSRLARLFDETETAGASSRKEKEG